MLYLDYAKPLTGGKYILNFFAESIEDLDSISHGQRFITKNGTDYGVPQPSSTVVITMPDKTKKTYVLNEAGEWQEGGVDMDYSKLENAPIILANLADKEFIPEANTYYEHLGETTEDFIKGIIYLYDGKEYKAIDGSGSGAGVQSDYNQNDSAAADYIKNRPFYEETKTGLTEVFNETLAFEWNETSNAGIYDKEYNGSNPMGEISVGTAMTVIFNGVEYSGTTQDLTDDLKEGLEPVGFTGFIFGASLPAEGGDWAPTAEFPFSIVYYGNDDYKGQAVAALSIITSIKQASIPVIIKTKATVTEIHTIEPKYIKDMYYSTEAFSPLIDFKVISGDINAIGSTMVVQYNGKEYTETVKDAAEEGSSEHIPYIGFKMGGTATPTEEQPFCYGINIMFNGNAKELYYASPKTVSENEVIIYNGESKTVKRLTMEDASILYVGNLHLLTTDFADTGEQYLTLFDFVSILTQGKLDLVASVVPADGISCEIKGENISYINPKYIKDMYYTKSDVGEKTLVFKGEINGITDKFSSLFEVGDTVSLKEDAVSLNVINYAKKYVSPDGSIQCVYVGNFYIIATAFELGGAEDTKEDYCCFYQISDSVDQLWYTNKNKKAPNNIEIYKGADPIVRIPEKYLPLDVAKKSYVDAAISDAITKTLNTEV